MIRNKKFIIVFFTLMGLTILLHANFKGIEKENVPYFSTKMQFKGVFYSNIDLFESIAEKSKSCDKLIFHYNPSRGIEQLDKINNGLSQEIWNLTQYCGINEIQKFEENIVIYQYHPVASSDIKIGARYYYETNSWEYYYEHDYRDCRHKHKLFYFLYDFLFNKGSL